MKPTGSGKTPSNSVGRIDSYKEQSAVASIKEKDLTEIEIGLNELGGITAKLTSLIEQCETRFATVLRPIETNIEGKDSGRGPINTYIGSTLASSVDQLTQKASHLQSIIWRCELPR